MYQTIDVWRGASIEDFGLGMSLPDRLGAVAAPLLPLCIALYALKRWKLKFRGFASVVVVTSVLWGTFYIATVAVMYSRSESLGRKGGAFEEDIVLH